MENFHTRLFKALNAKFNICMDKEHTNHDNNEEDICSFFVTDTSPCIQDGPQCGLVAVKVALEALNADTSSISLSALFKLAQEMVISRHGELFSADYAHRLISSLDPPIGTSVSHFPTAQDLLRQILSGTFFMVPYDCDFNFQPCLKKGGKAHWLTITGFGIKLPLQKLMNHQELYEFVQAYVSCGIFDLSVLTNSILLPSLLDLVTTSHILDRLILTCRHGKSKHLLFCFYEDLKLSNLNLFEVDPKRSPSDYVLPEEGISETLRNKVVVLSNK